MKRKKMISAILVAGCLLSQMGFCVLAEEPEEKKETRTYEELLRDAKTKSIEVMTKEELEAIKKYTYEMKVQTNEVEGWPKGPTVYAEAAIVMDMDTGAVLYGKNIDEKEYPASITKLLTTLVALDNSTLNDKVKFTQDSVDFMEYGDASVGMQPGEEITMKDALHAVLLASANEVSHAVAESVGAKMGGNYDTFIQAMNDYSEELGCTGSHWVNANGLHDDDHYTTAHDMARIAAAVSSKQEFLDIEKDLEYKIPPTNLIKEERVFQQNHKCLWPENYYYDQYCIGGKTGFTDQASTTLVTMFNKDGMRLVSVMMKDYGVTTYEDTKSLIDYAYTNFSKCNLKNEMLPDEILSLVDEDATVDLPKGVEYTQLTCELSDPDEVVDGVGTASYYYNGECVGSAQVKFSEEYLQKNVEPEIKPDPNKPEKSELKPEIPKTFFEQWHWAIATAGSGAVILILFLISQMKKRKRHK